MCTCCITPLVHWVLHSLQCYTSKAEQPLRRTLEREEPEMATIGFYQQKRRLSSLLVAHSAGATRSVRAATGHSGALSRLRAVSSGCRALCKRRARLYRTWEPLTDFPGLSPPGITSPHVPYAATRCSQAARLPAAFRERAGQLTRALQVLGSQ